MNKRTLILLCLALILLLVPGVVKAQKKNFPEVIVFDGAVDGGGSENIHPTTYSGPVQFSHKKHYAFYEVGCIDCHHDKDAATITKSNSSESLKCKNCHLEDGLIRGPVAESAASNDDLIARRANVLHILCIGCHKKMNAEKHAIRRPESCRMCHTKRTRDWSIE